jgi:hypothetical protein
MACMRWVGIVAIVIIVGNVCNRMRRSTIRGASAAKM